MRILTQREKNKRGCMECADRIITISREDGRKRCMACIHNQCPYHELDPYDTYSQYLKATKGSSYADWLERMFKRTGRMFESL